MKRRLIGDVWFSGRDDETQTIPFTDPDEYLEEKDALFPVDLVVADGETKQISLQKGWGKECRVEADFSVSSVDHGRLQTTVVARFYEGESVKTKDLEDTSHKVFTIGRGQTEAGTIKLRNHEAGAEDWGKVRFRLTNTLVEEP